MLGAVAEAFYRKIPADIVNMVKQILLSELILIVDEFYLKVVK